MISCNATKSSFDTTSWIINSRASAHITPNLGALIDHVPLLKSTQITLPTGDTAVVTHIENVHLSIRLQLQKVMCVPSFKHNLISVQQLLADNNCQVSFNTTHCVITDNYIDEVKGVGEARNGLYYLKPNINVLYANTVSTHADGNTSTIVTPNVVDPMELWHHRLGHVPLSKLKLIPAQQIGNIANLVIAPIFHCFLSTLTQITDPVHLNSELDALEMNKTWAITTLPPVKTDIGCKWIYKTKFLPDGRIDRFKARLVILGCKQKYGDDYFDTFEPVVKMTNLRTLLAVAAMQESHTIQMDVKNYFFYTGSFLKPYI